YQQRKQYAGNAAKQDQLDQAMYDLASYQVSAAAAILSGGGATPTATYTSAPRSTPTPTATASGVASYSIKNAWKGTYLYETGGKVAYGATATDNSYQCALEDKHG